MTAAAGAALKLVANNGPARRRSRGRGASSGRSTADRLLGRAASAASSAASRTGREVPGRGGAGLLFAVLGMTLGLVLLFRLVNEAQGGPRAVELGAAGLSRALRVAVLPVDPFDRSAWAAAPSSSVPLSPDTTDTRMAAAARRAAAYNPAPASTNTPSGGTR